MFYGNVCGQLAALVEDRNDVLVSMVTVGLVSMVTGGNR